MKNTVTADYIKSRIADVHYTSVPGTTTTICSIIVENGFVVSGTSACVDPNNFDRETGEEIAFDSAFQKLWELEGYLLKERIHQEQDEKCPGCPACEQEEKVTAGIKVRVISLDDLIKNLMH